MRLQKLSILMLNALCICAVALCVKDDIVANKKSETSEIPLAPEKTSVTTQPLIKKLPQPVYAVEQFTVKTDTIKDLSYKQFSEHLKLYQGYVDKRNDVADALNSVNLREANNRSYSTYRSLKLAETYTMNADILHRLYFQNLSGRASKPGQKMNKLIIEAFGSMSAFKEDLFAAALSAHGWVLTAYSLDDNRIHNYLLEAHNQTVPVLTLPLLVLDVYEHAYMIDFGIKRLQYLDLFWTSIDWSVVEERITRWVDPIRNSAQ